MEKEIRNLIDMLADSVMKEGKREYGETVQSVLDTMEKLPYSFDDPDVFSTMFMFPLEQLIDAVTKRLHAEPCSGVKDTSKPQFIFMQYAYLSSNIEKLIEKKMNSSNCIADKSRHILRMYLNYSLTGEIPETDMDEHYWVPRFGTNEQWMHFCDGLYRMYYGNNSDYLKYYAYLINEDIRKYPHMLNLVVAYFRSGTPLVIEKRYDKEVEIPQEKDGFYKISKAAFGMKMPYEDADNDTDDGCGLGRFFYRVPAEDIVKFEKKSEDVMI